MNPWAGENPYKNALAQMNSAFGPALLPSETLQAARRITHINAVKHLRNMALFEVRRFCANAGTTSVAKAVDGFNALMIRLNDDIKQPWLTHEISRVGFGGGIRKSEVE